MRMLKILEEIKNISDEDFEFNYPEFERSFNATGIPILSCDSPESIIEFLLDTFEYPKSIKYRGRDAYRYSDGTVATWIVSRSSWEFYNQKKLILILKLV